MARKGTRVEDRLDRLEKLVEISIRSTEEFRRSTEEFKAETRRQMAQFRRQMADFGRLLGNVGNTLGLTIEDRGQEIVGRYLRETEGISVHFKHRKIFRLNGMLREVDLIGEVKKNGQKMTVVCECKAKADRKDVEAFAKTVELIAPFLKGEIQPILFSYDVRKGAKSSAERLGITLVTPFDVSP